MKKSALIFSLLFFFSSILATNSDVVKLKKIINDAYKEHVNNAIKNDAIATAAIFDDNATIVEGESVIVGRDEINKLEGEFLNAMKVVEMNHTIEGLSIQGDYAYQLGKVTGKLIVKADNSKIDMLNNYMAAWKKQKDGSWQICYFVYYP